MQEKISYEEIRKLRIEQYGTEFKDWIWVLVKQYKDRTHFLFELLQNAEDEGATDVKIVLYRDRLEIEHNGHLFTKADVNSITKVAKSTKNAESGKKIGKFGIGFKSVYAYTATPKIYSGDYAFEIRDFINPYEIETVPLNSPNLTRMVLPFDNGEIAPEKAFLEIERAIREQLTATTLLFLDAITDIDIAIDGTGEGYHIHRKSDPRPDGFGAVSNTRLIYTKRLSTGKAAPKETSYLLFTDGEKEAIKLAFQVEDLQLIPVQNTRIATYFPTDKESHQAFYMHAPFETTPARDNIIEDSEKNARFIQSICDGIQMAFCWMRDHGYLSIQSLNNTYPVYEYPKDTIFHRIFDTAVSIIASGEKLLPTNKPGVYKSVDQVVFPESMVVATTLPDEDIQAIFGNQRLFWIAKEISTEACHTLREFFKSNFAFKTLGWREIVPKMDAAFLESKYQMWYERLFQAIRTVCLGNAANISKNMIDISSIPFVRLTNGRNICAYSNGNPIVYINNPEDCPNQIDKDYLNSHIISEFYQLAVRVPEYNVENTAISEIIPKYRYKDRVPIPPNSIQENIRDLKTIKDALIRAPHIRSMLQDAYIVTDGKEWYRPSELHIPSGYSGSTIPEYQLLEGIVELHYLSLGYQKEPKLDARFFQDIGCPATLQKVHVSRNDYLALVQKYLGRNMREELNLAIFSKEYTEGIAWDTSYEGFPEVIRNVDLKRSIDVARFLNKNYREITIKGELTGANDLQFSGKNVDTKTAYTAMGILLTYHPWLLTAEGVVVAPAHVLRRDLDARYERECKRLLDLLDFKEEDKAVEELLSRCGNIQEREALRTLLTDPEKLSEYTKALQKQKLKEIKKKEKENNPLAALDKFKKQPAATPQHYDDDYPEAVANPERRKRKLEDEFVLSLDAGYNVPKSTLKYTFQRAETPEEKSFLLAQYDGSCQICWTTITRKDGTRHFQAINVIKTSSLTDELLPSMSMGWNSLCLCPNCAAKYLYGAKDLSDFEDQVSSTRVERGENEYIDIHIRLQDTDEIIHYTPKHFLALQTVFEHYRK